MEQRKYIQEGQEGKSEGLSDSQHHLSAWEGDGKHCPENLAISKYMKDKNVIRSIQHGFMKGRSYLTSLIYLYDKQTLLAEV